VFTSFYTHTPDWSLRFSNKTLTIKNNKIYYLNNVYSKNSNLTEDRQSKITFIVNKDISNTKVFDNVVFSADLIDNVDTPAVISSVVFKTKTQETKPINYKNIELREDNYRFAIPRENNENQGSSIANRSYLGRMRGKYLICDCVFDCNNDKEFKIPYVKTTYRYSML
jgi:hypothetical protein